MALDTSNMVHTVAAVELAPGNVIGKGLITDIGYCPDETRGLFRKRTVRGAVAVVTLDDDLKVSVTWFEPFDRVRIY